MIQVIRSPGAGWSQRTLNRVRVSENAMKRSLGSAPRGRSQLQQHNSLRQSFAFPRLSVSSHPIQSIGLEHILKENHFLTTYRYSHNHSSENHKNIDKPKNDLEDIRKERIEKQEKLRDLLSEFGVSVAKIRESGNQKLKSRRRRSLRSNKLLANIIEKSSLTPSTISFNDHDEYDSIFNNPQRMAEQFDLYHNLGSYRRRRRSNSGGRYDNITARLRVRSVHAAQTIDVTAALSKVFGPNSQFPAVRHMFGRTSLIVQLSPIVKNDIKNEQKMNDSQSADTYFFDQATPRFVSLYRYGSIVFFNVSPKDAGQILESIKIHSIDPVARGFERKEAYEVAISPTLDPNGSTVNGDFATVHELDINNVAVISTIMAQTVAFDSYNDTVDEMLANFASINGKVKKTGNFTQMERETLFKIVAQNNSLFIDMLAKLGIKDRSDTAWNLSQYESIYDGMRSEFEIESRFENLEFKLNLIQQNAKFFLEILHNSKSQTLEWVIIILITFECIIMLMDMSGLGPSVLGSSFMEYFGHNENSINSVPSLETEHSTSFEASKS